MRAQLQRAFGGNQRSQLKSASVEDTSDSSERATRDLDGMREEMGKEGLKLWESAYKLRPAPSARPSDWTVDDLCFMLEQQGLANCSERSPFSSRRAESRACSLPNVCTYTLVRACRWCGRWAHPSGFGGTLVGSPWWGHGCGAVVRMPRPVPQLAHRPRAPFSVSGRRVRGEKYRARDGARVSRV